MKIDLVLTGGTIGSSKDESGVIHTDPEIAVSTLAKNLYEKMPSRRHSVEFNMSRPFDMSSEDLNLSHWNKLIKHLRNIDIKESSGIIITHGTDTLGFTANLLSLLFHGVDIPVFLVSSSKPLTNEDANGFDNFNKAVELICESVKPSVYVPYRNRNGEMIIHEANRLLQSQDLSPDFHSSHHKLNVIEDIYKELGSEEPLLYCINELSGNILSIAPYPGLDYSNYNLDTVKCILHRTYHSSTLSIGETDNEISTISNHSIFKLKEECDKRNIPIYFTPVLPNSQKVYYSTDEIIKRGIIPLHNMTYEMSYVYLILKH